MWLMTLDQARDGKDPWCRKCHHLIHFDPTLGNSLNESIAIANWTVDSGSCRILSFFLQGDWMWDSNFVRHLKCQVTDIPWDIYHTFVLEDTGDLQRFFLRLRYVYVCLYTMFVSFVRQIKVHTIDQYAVHRCCGTAQRTYCTCLIEISS